MYTFNPYISHTREEIDQIAKDIKLGICKMEVPARLTNEEYYGKANYKRRERSQRIGEAVNRIRATRFKVR